MPCPRACLAVEELEPRNLLSAAMLTEVAQPALGVVSPALTLGQIYYNPSTIKTIYGFSTDPTAGKGETIALVDAYNEPKLSHDVSEFDSYFSLPQFGTTGGPQLTVVNQTGGTTLPKGNVGWGVEIALDVEWAHAIAPGANILLVEAKSAQLGDLLTATDYAAAHAQVVSMSWVGNEQPAETTLDSHFAVAGVTFVAAAGDTAGVTGYPAASPYVISVGGSSLRYEMADGSIESWESAWSSGSGGVSRYEAKPPYQAALPYLRRAMPDVSFNANPNYGYAVYDSYGQPGAVQVGGTSRAAPQWAALIANADAERAAKGLPSLSSLSTLTALYETVPSSDFYDITTGSAGHNHAAAGYDLATGLGSPGDAATLIADLAKAPDTLVLLPAIKTSAAVKVRS